jgi:hypothetical protein
VDHTLLVLTAHLPHRDFPLNEPAVLQRRRLCRDMRAQKRAVNRPFSAKICRPLKRPRLDGGAEGNRTPDLLIENATIPQAASSHWTMLLEPSVGAPAGLETARHSYEPATAAGHTHHRPALFVTCAALPRNRALVPDRTFVVAPRQNGHRIFQPPAAEGPQWDPRQRRRIFLLAPKVGYALAHRASWGWGHLGGLVTRLLPVLCGVLEVSW